MFTTLLSKHRNNIASKVTLIDVSLKQASHKHAFLCSIVCSNDQPNTPCQTDIDSSSVCCGTSRFSHRGCRVADFVLIFTNLLLVYSNKKYISIILVPNCTCAPIFNFGQFIVSRQSCAEKLALSVTRFTHPISSLLHTDNLSLC